MSTGQHLVGVYSYVDTTMDGIRKLKSSGVRDYTVHMPTYIEELAEEIDQDSSPVKWVTLVGALVGFASAILMTGWMSWDWPVRISMKPVMSWPAYTVIMFELTVLLGGIANLLALFGFAKLPGLGLGPGFDPRFTDDKFGIVVPVDDSSAEQVRKLLDESGAEEIEHVGA